MRTEIAQQMLQEFDGEAIEAIIEACDRFAATLLKAEREKLPSLDRASMDDRLTFMNVSAHLRNLRA